MTELRKKEKGCLIYLNTVYTVKLCQLTTLFLFFVVGLYSAVYIVNCVNSSCCPCL